MRSTEGMSVWGMVLVVSCLLAAPPAWAQWSDGYGGTHDVDIGNSFSPSPRRPQQHYNQGGNDTAEILRDVFQLGDALIREGQRQQQQPPQWHQPQSRPQYYRQQPQMHAAPPRPLAPPPAPAPPKNTVVTKKKPAANSLNLSNNLVRRASAETDARQLVEAGNSKAMLDAAITGEIGSSNDPELKEDWAEVVQDGFKTEDVDKFLAKHGASGTGKAPADMRELLELRQKFGRYGDNLNNGSLTAAGKDQALQELQQSVSTLGAKQGWDDKFLSNMAGNVTEMQNFNTMGKIADAAQHTPNPFSPLVQGATQIGMPVMFVSEMTGYPVMSVDPVGNAVGEPAKILIFNPEATGQSVSYLLDSHKYEMASGSQQRLDKTYMISFDSGVGGAQKKYQLSDGVYEWRTDAANGWNLYKTKVKVVIDNSRYDGEFKYLLNNEAKSVGPGEVVEHESDAVIEIAFDGGKGGEEIRKRLKPGKYVVGIDPDNGHLDLFDAAKVAKAEAEHPDYLPSTLAGNNATREQRVEALLSQLQSADGAGASAPGKKAISPVGAAAAPQQSVDALLKSLKTNESGG